MLFRLSSLVVALYGVSLVNSQQPYPITGVKVDPKNGVPLRKNINDFQAAGGPQWELYIRALIDIYKQDPTATLSFFQIAGIHGKPYVEWDRTGPRSAGANDWAGYCPHGEDLFLPWHRPYLILYEQRLVEVATRLANQYPTKFRAQYQQAAQTLRSPYWDWAASSTVPQATVPGKITIKVPKGNDLQNTQVDNPLATYKFPKSALSGSFGAFDDQNRAQIYRCPSPQTYPGSANDLLSRDSYKQWVYDAFTKSTTFKQFASTASTGISLEQIHNSVHWDGACGGQFLDADFAAFDPLFMLHHTNVDRLWAYWQFIRPNESLFKGSYSGQSRFSSPDGTTINTNSPLQPFLTAPGKFHTSTSVQTIKGFGYTYEGLEYWQKNDQQLKQDATALINKLYATGNLRVQKRDGNSDATRYFVQASVDVEELDRPCAVKFFLGDTDVGRLVIMKQPQKGIVNGEFGLDEATNSIQAQVKTATKVVNNVLSDLRVEITKVDGTVIPLSSVPSLKLQLVNATVVPPETDTQLAEYTDQDQRVAPKKEAEVHRE